MFDDDLLLFIHEPARLVLLTNLAAVTKADFVFLLNSTELSRGNLSVQMKRLQEKGLVQIEKMIDENRPRTVYQITRTGRSALKRYKKEMLDLLQFLRV
jgi:DNA-binding PadR family transcriptional regulator